MDSGFGGRGDFSSDVIRNMVPGVTRVAGLGVRSIAAAFSSTTGVDIWQGSAATYPYPGIAVALEAVSDSDSDTASGVGMQTITIGGLNSAYGVESSGAVSLNGATPVAIPGSFLRINSALGSMLTPITGTQTNIGTITIRDAGGGATRAVIPPGAGQLQQAIYTPPAGFSLIIYSLEAELLTSAGGTARGADFALFFRLQNGFGRMPRRIGATDMQPYLLDAKARIMVPEKVDFSIRCTYTSNNNITVGGAFEGHLTKNP